MAASPGLYYSSSQSAPAQPSSVSYSAVPFLYEPLTEGVYSHPQTYPASSSSVPDMSSMASWTTAPGWDSASRTSPPIPDGVGALPPPPFYQAGELAQYEGSIEHGNSERETEELNSVSPPPPPPYPEPGFQAGELSLYASISEHGNEERETEEQGFMPPPPYASAPQSAEGLSVASMSEEGPGQPGSQGLGAMGPDTYYLFLTGQLPPGTISHFKSDYETGRDHWDEVHYERYYYPYAQQQTPEVPSDGLVQQPQDYTKS